MTRPSTTGLLQKIMPKAYSRPRDEIIILASILGESVELNFLRIDQCREVSDKYTNCNRALLAP